MQDFKPLSVFWDSLSSRNIHTLSDLVDPQKSSFYKKCKKVLESNLALLCDFVCSEEDRAYIEFIDSDTEEAYIKQGAGDVDTFLREYHRVIRYQPLPFPEIKKEEIETFLELSKCIKVDILPVILETYVYADIVDSDQKVADFLEKLEFNPGCERLFKAYYRRLALKNAALASSLFDPNCRSRDRDRNKSKLKQSLIRLTGDKIPEGIKNWCELDFVKEVPGICLTGPYFCPTYSKTWHPIKDALESVNYWPEPSENLLTRLISGEAAPWLEYRNKLPELEIIVPSIEELEEKVDAIFSRLGEGWKVEQSSHDSYLIFLEAKELASDDERREWIRENLSAANIRIYHMELWQVQTQPTSAIRTYLTYQDKKPVMYADPSYIYTTYTNNDITPMYTPSTESIEDMIKSYNERGIYFGINSEFHMR